MKRQDTPLTSTSSLERRAAMALLALGTTLPACVAPIEEGEQLGEAADELFVLPPQHPMDPDLFESYLDAQLAPLVKGYAATAGRNGVIVAEASAGVARNPAGGGGFQIATLMSVNTPSNVGSVSKYFSGTALLYFMQQRDDKTLDEWLDTPFIELLPAPWTVNSHASLDDITIRMLLQHKSGIRQSSENPFTLLANGVSQANVGNRSYNNLNYKLLTYLIPVIALESRKYWIDYFANAFGNETSRIILGKWYHEMMMEEFVPALPWAIDPSCRPTTEYANTYALTYASKTDNGQGQVWDSWVQEEGCRAQGGWYFSARDLTKLGMAIQNGNSVVDGEVRDRMWDSTNPDDRIVFSGFESGAWMGAAFGGENLAPLHNGSHGWNGVRAESVIMVMPDNTVLSVVINSPVGTATLENMIENAYRASLGL